MCMHRHPPPVVQVATKRAAGAREHHVELAGRIVGVSFHIQVAGNHAVGVLQAFIEDMNGQLRDEEQWIVETIATPPTPRFSLIALWRRWTARKQAEDGGEHRTNAASTGRS
jgi:hypothetical protein